MHMLSCVSLWPPPMDCSPPDSSVHGIFQARILEWVAMASSRGSSRPRDGTWVSCTGREDSLPLSLLGSPAWKTWLQGTKYLWGLKHTKVHFSPLKKNKECKITMNFFFKKACNLQDMVLTQVFKSYCLFGLSFSGTGPPHFKFMGTSILRAT